MEYDTEGCDLYVGTATGFYVDLGGTKAIKVNKSSGVQLTDGDTTLLLSKSSLTIDGYSVDDELKTYTFKTSWNKKSSFQVYKGFVVKVEDETDEEEGQQLGDLAWLDKVVISSATFKLGSSAISMTQSTNGDTATFTGTIPVSEETYSLRGSRIYGLYTREYNSTTGEYEYSSYSGSAYSSAGSVTVNTVSSTSLTATITVEAVAND
jgi:hypothetical protein